MLGVIAKLTIKPGTNAAFETAMKALQDKVRRFTVFLFRKWTFDA